MNSCNLKVKVCTIVTINTRSNFFSTSCLELRKGERGGAHRLKLRTIVLDARRTHGRTVTNRVLHSHNSSPVIAQLESFRPGHDSRDCCLFTTNFVRITTVSTFFFFSSPRGSFHCESKGFRQWISTSPLLPRKCFFQQFETKFR